MCDVLSPVPTGSVSTSSMLHVPGRRMPPMTVALTRHNKVNGKAVTVKNKNKQKNKQNEKGKKKKKK